MKKIYSYFLNLYKQGLFDELSNGTAIFHLSAIERNAFPELAEFKRIEVKRVKQSDLFLVEITN